MRNSDDHGDLVDVYDDDSIDSAWRLFDVACCELQRQRLRGMSLPGVFPGRGSGMRGAEADPNENEEHEKSAKSTRGEGGGES